MNGKVNESGLYPRMAPPAGLRQTATRPAHGESRDGKAVQPFQQLLRRELVRLSHHAEVRMQQRGIELDRDDWAKLNAAIDKAAAKGAKDSLVLMNGLAPIVNVPNRTVVTAVDQSNMKEQVFTQIDSAVILS